MVRDWGWIHYIGNSHYTAESFIEEAKIYGISRRISFAILKEMNWGDWIACIMKVPGKMEAKVFLEFRLDRMIGVSAELLKHLEKKSQIGVGMTLLDYGGHHILRECGSYEQGATFGVDCTVQQLSQTMLYCEKHGTNLGTLMVGCSPGRIRIVPEPNPTLFDIKFHRGFKAFDRRKFWRLVRSVKKRGVKIRIKAEFPSTVKRHNTTEGELIEVHNYKAT